MSKNKTKFQGKDAFEYYYSLLYGTRWDSLKESLFSSSVYACIKSEQKEPYYLDIASAFCAMQLPLKGSVDILDLCAAPGGKTLILANRMDETAFLTSNERSAQRKQRLVQVCDNSLSENIRSRVNITCSDGAKLCTIKTECFDSILLDAPCSSERHVLQDEKYLKEWTSNRVKSLAMEQWALLSSAWRLLREGGYLLYSTCALSALENDYVVNRLFKKFDNVKLCKEEVNMNIEQKEYESFCSMPCLPCPEKTEYGFHILPDKNNGAGPIYFCLLQKLSL